MGTWVDRIKVRMQELDFTQEDLAKKLGITRGAVAHYVMGRRVPPLKQFQKLASALKTDPVWLQYGDQQKVKTTSIKKTEKAQKPQHFPIPILSWKQAAERATPRQTKTNETIPHFYTDQAHWYALRVKGDAMVSSHGARSFHEGDIIIVDSDKEAAHGDLVIAVLPRAKEATFKQYVIDSGTIYLKPLNMQYPLLVMDKKTVVLGVVMTGVIKAG